MVSGLPGDVTRGQAAGLERDLRGRVDGGARSDAGTRGAYSTDASNFRQVPVGVVLPRTPEAAVAGRTHTGRSAPATWCCCALAGTAWPPRGSWFLFLPLNLVDGTGAPGRALAVLS
jgi:hypothetical protein